MDERVFLADCVKIDKVGLAESDDIAELLDVMVNVARSVRDVNAEDDTDEVDVDVADSRALLVDVDVKV